VISGGIYFILREVIRAIFWVEIGCFNEWWKDPTSYVHIFFILVMIIFPGLMLTKAVNFHSSTAEKKAFQSFSALAACFFWFFFSQSGLIKALLFL
jgi:hypothetical protein